MVSASGEDWAQAKALIPLCALPPSTRRCTHTHTHCILHLTDLEPAAREIVWGILMYMYKPELEAPHPLQNLSLPPQTPTTDVGQVLSIVLNCPCANNYLAPSLPRVWGLL